MTRPTLLHSAALVMEETLAPSSRREMLRVTVCEVDWIFAKSRQSLSPSHRRCLACAEMRQIASHHQAERCQIASQFEVERCQIASQLEAERCASLSKGTCYVVFSQRKVIHLLLFEVVRQTRFHHFLVNI